MALLSQGRFSSLGARPAMEIIAKEGKITILNNRNDTKEEKTVDDPMSEPEQMAAKWKPVLVDGLPDTFCGNVKPRSMVFFFNVPFIKSFFTEYSCLIGLMFTYSSMGIEYLLLAYFRLFIIKYVRPYILRDSS